MLAQFAKQASILTVVCLLCMTQPALGSEIVNIPRSQQESYCPAYYDKKYCTVSQNNTVCVKGVSVRVPTATPTPTYTPSPTHTPTPAQSQDQTQDTTTEEQSDKPSSLNSDMIFEMINNHRATLNLPPFQKDDQLCSLAKERGPELYDEIFVNHNIHGGFYSRDLPYWITENMKYGDNETDVFSWWLSSGIHRKAIEGNFTYSCGECYGKSCVQLFTSYQPK